MTKTEFRDHFNLFFSILSVLVIISVLYIVSRYNYLIFHTLAEFFSIVIACSLFVIVWNTRKTIENDALVFLGIAYLFIGGCDLFHALSYKGMGTFGPELGANPATQLWLVARYMESISLFLFPFLFNKRINFTLVFWVYSIISVIACFAIFFWKIFPACFIEGFGLTTFKKTSEYIICLFLALSLFFLHQKRNVLDQIVYKLLFMSIGMTIISELAFTFYISVYGFSNFIGHLFKIFTFYLVYKAMAYTGLKKPHDLLFKELRDKEQCYRQMFETNQAVKLIINPENGSIIEANEAACNFYGYSKEEITSLSIFDINALTTEQVVKEMNKTKFENKLVFNFPHRLASGEIREVEVYSGPVQSGENTFLYSIIQDITKRKQAEQKIKSHADNLSIIFNSVPNILAIVNDKGRIEMINNKGTAFGRKEKEEFLGLWGGEVLNCLTSFDGKGCGRNSDCSECPVRMRVMSTFKTEKSHIDEECQMTFFIDDKEMFLNFLISTSLLKLNGDKKVLLSLTNITERKQSEQSLIESEIRFSEMFEHMSSGAAVYEPIKKGDDFIFKAFNAAAEKITRIKRKNVLGKRLLEIFPNMDKTGFLDVLQEVWKSGKEVHLEPFYYKDNVRKGWRENRIYKLPSGEVVALFDDVTLRIESESAIKKSEKKYRTLFHKSNDGIIVHNLNGQILDINNKIEQMLDYQTDDFTQLNLKELLPPFDMEILKEVLEETKIKGYTKFETKLNRHDGSIIDVEVSSSIVDQNAGTVQSIVRDLTDQKEMEKRVLHSQKMESIGSLAGGIAHDFNNILFPIVGMSEMLLEDMPEQSPVHENVQVILKAGQRAAKLVQQILTFSRQNEHKVIPVRIQQVLKEVLRLTRSTIPSNIEIVQQIQHDCGLVMADPTQIHQVAMNIITNAFHAIEFEGGIITVLLKEILLEGDDLVSTSLGSDRYAKLSISDNGHGILPELMNKIFEPYFTTKGQGKGTGLGLSVVYGIIKDHKGEITVDSEPQKGTTFNIFLPIMKKTSVVRQIKAGDQPTGDERVLLVDDEESIIKISSQMLIRLGYKVTSFVNSLEALEAFKDKPDTFDIVITDMTMPLMTGNQLAKELMTIRPNIPIVMCTGFSESIDQEKAKASGFKGLLMKPIFKSDMANMVRKVLDKASQDLQSVCFK
ncbi:hybrid sensor histidine kinase/response regulator [Desulfobacula phenolica]|nr:MASE3 domain-containing protein [Desulfobacula phenolica]